MDNEERELKKQLALKILKAAENIGVLKKDGHNKHSDYDFISSEQMLTGNRLNFPKVKLCVIPSLTESIEKNYVAGSGNGGVRSLVKMEFELIDTETGYSQVVKWQGADQDVGGKSFTQAITQSCKSFYFKLFNITSTGDKDPDSITTVRNGNDEVDEWMTKLKIAVPENEEKETVQKYKTRQIIYMMKETGVVMKDVLTIPVAKWSDMKAPQVNALWMNVYAYWSSEEQIPLVKFDNKEVNK